MEECMAVFDDVILKDSKSIDYLEKENKTAGCCWKIQVN